MAKAKKKKVVHMHKRRFRLNIGVVIFGVVFLYLLFYIVTYITRDKISYYEVVKGSSSEQANKTYTGIALRDETVFTTDTAGYVNFYVQEGQRVNVNSTLYSVDENGYVSELLASSSEEANVLTTEDLKDIKDKISQFTTDFETNGFSAVYDFKYDLNAVLLDALSVNMLDSIYDTLAANGQSNVFKIIKAPQTGIVVHSTDGYESLTLDGIHAGLFDLTGYSANKTKSNDLVNANSAIGKIIQDEVWQIVIPLSAEDAAKYAEKTSLNVRFTKDNTQARCNFEIQTKADGTYGVMTFYRFMVRYAVDRYIDLQILDSVTEGLKVPKTAIVDFDLYTVPAEYYIQGGDSNSYGFYLETYNEDGTSTIKFITPTVYYVTDELCYVAKDQLQAKDIIIKPDSSERYQIGATGVVQGAYQINSGYTIFKRVEILAESNDYYIIKEGVSNGLIVYDHIVLDASLVDDSEIVYQ